MTKVRGDGNKGRTSDIGKVVRVEDDGTQVTVADAIVEGVRVGLYLEPAIAATGVGKTIVYEWMKIAGKVRTRSHGDPDVLELTDHELACCVFLDALESASGMWEKSANVELERLGRGGIAQEVVTIKIDAEGNEEVTTRTSKTLPDARVLMWRLERRFPSRYGQRIQLTDKDAVELSPEERAEALVVSAREHRARQVGSGPARPRKVPAKKS